MFPTKGWSGATFRLFNPETQLWSIWWASGQTGTLFPPVTGRFVDGRGDFYGDDEHEGKPIKAHFIWSRHHPDLGALGAGVLGRRRRDLGE